MNTVQADWVMGGDDFSPLFEEMTKTVARILLQSATLLIQGHSVLVASRILEELMTTYGLVVASTESDWSLTKLTEAVDELIVDDAFAIFSTGNLRKTANMILVQLANVHHMRPRIVKAD